MNPDTPLHSLPSYDEPTPETHAKLTREEEAELALKNTEFTLGARILLIALFLLTISSVATIQLIRGAWPTTNLRTFLHAAQIKAFEKSIENDSVVSQWLLPRVQFFLNKLGAGNEQVYLGRDGWLYYRPDVDYVTGPGFLASTQLKKRAHAAGVQADPVKAIVQFRDQLAARGIALILLPVPPKTAGHNLQNASFADFRQRMAAEKIPMLECAPEYLQTDTHWRPESMEQVARDLAALIRSHDTFVASENSSLTSIKTPVANRGDIARMLKTSDAAEQTVGTHQILSGDSFWRPSREAEVLLFGDSFTNIYSLGALGWGESAGLAEQLSYSLGGAPLDCIVRNSDGAFATREILARELARGRDRLAGKKLVVWEFAARELAFGDWKLLELKLGQPTAAKFFTPQPNESLSAIGVVEAVSSVPRPGSVPYADHIMAVQLSELKIAGRAEDETLQAIVYLQSMRDNVWTPAARLRAGDKISLTLRAWADVAGSYEQINRSELDDPALQLEEPAWGDLLR